MLYKPSKPSPYNSVVDSKDITFSASCVSTSDITGLRLAIKDDICDYYLPLRSSVVRDCLTPSSIQMELNTTNFNSGDGYCIQGSRFDRTDNVDINNIIKPLGEYRWQVRLYQAKTSPTVNIAYGFVNKVIRYNNPASSPRRILKVRPHTNMFMKHGTSNSAYNLTINKKFTEYYDDNVAYYIQFNGAKYEGKDYYYAKTRAYYSSDSWQDLTVEKQYDEPLFAYIEIDMGSDDEEIEVNDEYTIITNYIDSNEYYFSCRQLSEVVFKDKDGDTITGFADVDDMDKTKNLITSKYADFTLTGSFPPNSSAAINYYRVTLYRMTENEESILVGDSGYVYGSTIDYTRKDMIDGNLYKLIVTITDTYGNTVSKGAYVSHNGNGTAMPAIVTAQRYPKHNSVIVDFSKLISISGKCAPQKDGYNITEDGKCEVQGVNTVTYSTIDGTDKELESDNPLLYLTAKCTDGDTQQIFHLDPDVETYQRDLLWDRYVFIFSQYSPLHSGASQRNCIYSPYSDTIPELNTNVFTMGNYGEWDMSLLPSSVMDKIKNKIHEGLKIKGDVYNVPYLAFDDLTVNDTAYTHTESAAHDFWWEICVSRDEVYIKCVNPPEGHKWEFREEW